MTLAGAELILSNTPEYPYFTAKVSGPFFHSKIPEEESPASALGVNFPIISLTVVSGEKINKKFSFLFSSGVKHHESHFETWVIPVPCFPTIKR